MEDAAIQQSWNRDVGSEVIYPRDFIKSKYTSELLYHDELGVVVCCRRAMVVSGGRVGRAPIPAGQVPRAFSHQRMCA